MTRVHVSTGVLLHYILCKRAGKRWCCKTKYRRSCRRCSLTHSYTHSVVVVFIHYLCLACRIKCSESMHYSVFEVSEKERERSNEKYKRLKVILQHNWLTTVHGYSECVQVRIYVFFSLSLSFAQLFLSSRLFFFLFLLFANNTYTQTDWLSEWVSHVLRQLCRERNIISLSRNWLKKQHR